jgi:hypothetical protein
MFRVQHYAYCGLADVPACHDERAEARKYTAERLRRYRRRFHVVTLERGSRWEICEPDNCTMVPDACGTLRLIHQTFDCRECGTDHETHEHALHCCADYGHDFDESN